MKSLLAILLLLFPLPLAAGEPIQLALTTGVQAVVGSSAAAAAGTSPDYQAGCGNSSGGATELICDFTTNPSAGDAIFGIIWTTTARTVSSVCDGTGAGACTGGSTYTLSEYSNSTNFKSTIFYTCNYQGSTDPTVTYDSSASTYAVAVHIKNGSASCVDATTRAQSTTNGTTFDSGTIVTTNNEDLLVGLFANDCGAGTYTAGNDGDGHSYTLQVHNNQVVMAETYARATTGTVKATATYSTGCKWNAHIYGVK